MPYFTQTSTGIMLELPNDTSLNPIAAMAEALRAAKAYDTLINLCVPKGSAGERAISIFYVGHVLADEEVDGYGLCRLSQPVRVLALSTNTKNSAEFQLDLGHDALGPWTVQLPPAGDFAGATGLVPPAKDQTDYRTLRGRFEFSFSDRPVSQEVPGHIPVKEFWPDWYAELVGDGSAGEPIPPDPRAIEIARLKDLLKQRAVLMDAKVRALSSLIKSDPSYRATTQDISGLVAAQKADKARLEALERGAPLEDAPAPEPAPAKPARQQKQAAAPEPTPPLAEKPEPDPIAEPTGKQPRKRKQSEPAPSEDIQDVLAPAPVATLKAMGITLMQSQYDDDRKGAQVVFATTKSLSRSALKKAEELLGQVAPSGLKQPLATHTDLGQSMFTLAINL